MNDEKENIENLKFEYQILQAGYNSRDQAVHSEFSKIIQTFSIFLTVILAVSVFIKFSQNLHLIFILLIGLAGLLSLVALLVDLESKTSCKVLIRNRSIKIERKQL